MAPWMEFLVLLSLFTAEQFVRRRAEAGGRRRTGSGDLSRGPGPPVTTSSPVREVTKNGLVVIPRLPQAGPRSCIAGLGASVALAELAQAARGPASQAAPRWGLHSWAEAGLKPQEESTFFGGGGPPRPTGSESASPQKPDSPHVTVREQDGRQPICLRCDQQNTSREFLTTPRWDEQCLKHCAGRGWGVAVACPTLLRESGWLSGTWRTWEVTGKTSRDCGRLVLQIQLRVREPGLALLLSGPYL